MKISRLTALEDSWLAMRQALWPGASREEHLAEIAMWCADGDRYGAFMAVTDAGEEIAFAEAAIRYDYVNGADTSPVGFLEGIHVAPAYRNQGVARKLVRAIADWVISRGCRELASDAKIDNTVSQAMHKALGFEETERVVYFRKGLL